MTSRPLPVPTRARVPLAGVSWPSTGEVRTLHAGRSGVLFGPIEGGPDPLLPVTSVDRGLVPGGICVPDVAELQVLVDAARRTDVVDLSAWMEGLAHTTSTDLAVRRGPVDRRAARQMVWSCTHVPTPTGGVMDPTPLRRRADRLAGAAMAGARDEVVRHLTALVGAGPGSTPTGDDIVIGVLAALDRHAGARSTAAAGLVRHELPLLLGRTTAVSRHDLAAAVAGQFAERVHALVRALARPSLVPAVVRAALGWGATSGIDLAHGVAAAATAASAAPGVDRLGRVGRVGRPRDDRTDAPTPAVS